MLRKVVYKVLGPNIGKQTRRVLNYYKSGMKKINSIVEYKTYSYGYHTSCGYYDLDPVRNGMLLLITTDNAMENAVIHKICLNTKVDNNIGEGSVANWQQGNRLKWINDDTIIFNSFKDGQYISSELYKGNTKSHPWPVYDIKNNLAVSLDFNRLGWLRPGYGYTKFPLSEIQLDDCAIRMVDLSSDQEILCLSYWDLINNFPRKVDLQKCYINHLSFSPSGQKFMFFFIEIKNGVHQCSLCVYDGGKIVYLDTELSASHYVWKNDDEILTTSYDKNRNCRYYLYSIKDQTRMNVLPELLKQDGHPTYVNDHTIITDTYPDKAGFQHIYLVDTDSKKMKEYISIYSSAKHMGVERCDLHPRYSKERNEVYFDADIDGHRRVYSFKLD